MNNFFDSSLFTWGVLPLLIFVARIADMSLDTMRIITIGQGRRFMAALLGFFEVAIWLSVARQVIVHLPNPLCFWAYAAGFATGNYVGMMIEERLASGVQMVRAVVNQDPAPIIAALRDNGYGATLMTGQGLKGPVSIIFTIVDRSRCRDVVLLIESINSKVFYTIEDLRSVSEGILLPRRENSFLHFFKRK